MEKMFRKVRLSVSVSAALTLVIGLALTALLFASVRRAETQHPGRPLPPAGGGAHQRGGRRHG